MNTVEELAGLPTPALVGLGVLIVIQLMAMVWALIVLLRDTRSVIAGLSRPIWLCAIVFGQLVGPVAFLVMAHRERRERNAQREYERRTRSADTSRGVAAAVDNLYQG
ncbi:PLDc N-terminal domain-containing protein [Corynebacterium uterequi]|uniref:Phospholipase_D-nuclease N-terminal n=1 Tax=Corynebacterium uterequi TaxID=1072256 RepID=A0A0G3HCY8_9CORY|nr:PLDc N-terminal domain-containing protein [Corynebacterium uterequi]AKK11139.1 Phospholipase_D-nuclease N-terminal [Corynebacterium uterequi]